MNNILLNTLVKTFGPKVEKLANSGKIDALVREMKSKYEKNPDDEIYILVSTEDDGNEYINFIKMDQDMTVTEVIDQLKLSDVIIQLIQNSEKCL